MDQPQKNNLQSQLLTPLERELLNGVREWIATLTKSIGEQDALQQDTVDLLTRRLDALESLVVTFMTWQVAYNKALIGYAEHPNNKAHRDQLAKAIEALDRLHKAASSKKS